MKKRSRIEMTSAILMVVVLVLASDCKLNSISEVDRQETQEIRNQELVKVKTYYYDQLTWQEKKIYEQLNSSKEKIMEEQEICVARIDCFYSEKMQEEINHYLQRAIWAYRLDDPISTLWFNHYDGYMMINGEQEKGSLVTVVIMITPGEKGYYDFASKEELQTAIKAVEEKVERFVQQLSGTDEQKVSQIQDWLLQGTTYDSSAKVSNMSTLYGCIIQKKCVCGGLTYSFKYVADQAKIPVISVSGGDLYGGEQNTISHAWNMVWIKGEWKRVDITDVLANGRGKNPLKFLLQGLLYFPSLFKFPYP